jgi:hypothetical protein
MEYSEISNKIKDEIKNTSPKNIDELVQIIQLKYGIPKKQILDVVTNLIDSKEIDLQFPIQNNQKFGQFVLSIEATWFWLVLFLSMVSIASIYVFNDNTSPLIYIRNIMGFIFSLFLPGYGFIKAVLPYREFSQLERTMLSIGSSMALVPFVGLFLNYLNQLSLVPILISVFMLTIVCSIIGIIREFSKIKSF